MGVCTISSGIFDFLEALLSCRRSFLGLVTPVDLLWRRRKRMLAGRSPATRRVGVWRVGGELFCALDFTFLRGEASSPRGGVSPRGYWFTTWRERSDWTRTRRNPKGAPQRSRRVEWLLVRARGTYIARTPEQSSGVLAISAPPTGLEPVTLRLTVECSAN